MTTRGWRKHLWEIVGKGVKDECVAEDEGDDGERQGRQGREGNQVGKEGREGGRRGRNDRGRLEIYVNYRREGNETPPPDRTLRRRRWGGRVVGARLEEEEWEEYGWRKSEKGCGGRWEQDDGGARLKTKP